jgi:hypothetical protein
MLSALLKTGFAGGILYWLISSGKLDFKILAKLLDHGPNLFIALSLMVLAIILTSYRWKMLLEVKADRKIPFLKIIPINWIGLFFSTFLPGIVTGDVVKLLYVKDLDPKFSKTFLLTSVVIDRILGLCGLLLMAGILSAVNYNELVSLAPDVAPLLQFNFLLFSGVIAFLIGVFLPKRFQNTILILIDKIPLIGHKIKDTLQQVWLFGVYKKTTTLSLILSTFTQFIGIVAIWTLTSPFYGKPINIAHLFGFVPAGLVTISIPISPAGAGVGHLIFDKLFALMGVAGGASLFNIYFLCMITVNLCGVIPYLMIGKKHSIDEAEHFEDDLKEAKS